MGGSYQEGKSTTQGCCPKHSSGKWRACARVQGEVEQDQGDLKIALRGRGDMDARRRRGGGWENGLPCHPPPPAEQFSSRPRNFIASRSRSRSLYIGSPLNVSYAEFFRFSCNFCACKCACTVVVRSPRRVGGPSLGDRPPGGGGGPSSLRWGTTRGGGTNGQNECHDCVCALFCV